MTHPTTICIGAVRATTAALLLFAASAGAQGTSGSAAGTAADTAAAPKREHPSTTAANRHAASTHDAGQKKTAMPKRDGDFGRAPFGTGGRRHDASNAGAPSAKPQGESTGTAGTR